MAKITHSIDWLQYSCAWPNEVREWPFDDQEQLAILRTCVPAVSVAGLPPQRPASDKIFNMAGYPETFDMLYASAHVNPRRREQKIGVRMTGQNLAAYRDLGGTEARLLEFVQGVRGKTSRIDLAFDLFDYEVDLQRVYRDWKSGKVRTNARGVQPLIDATRNADGSVTEAVTLYFGSRTSEVMVRMYDKGKQMRTDLDWLRVEVEVKGDKAVQVAADCNRLGVGDVGRQLLRDYITQAPYKFWRELVKGSSVELTPVGRKATDQEAWLRNIIIPLIAEQMRHEWDSCEETGITSLVEGLIRENWQIRSLAIRKQYQAWQRPIQERIELQGGAILK